MENLDILLERYLGLLDEYQRMKTRLHDDLAAGYLSLARANFAPSGRARYGQDYYDDRMQASRVVITSSDGGPVKVKTVEVEEKEEVVTEESNGGLAKDQGSTNGENAKPKQQKKQKQVGGMIIGAEEIPDLADGLNDLDLSRTNGASATPEDPPESSVEKTEHDEAISNADPGRSASDSKPSSSATRQKNGKSKTDPIHMFGVLVPQALRQAQGSFVKAVVGSVLRLVELDSEMRELEIEIRRTRKMLAKQA